MCNDWLFNVLVILDLVFIFVLSFFMFCVEKFKKYLCISVYLDSWMMFFSLLKGSGICLMLVVVFCVDSVGSEVMSVFMFSSLLFSSNKDNMIVGDFSSYGMNEFGVFVIVVESDGGFWICNIVYDFWGSEMVSS